MNSFTVNNTLRLTAISSNYQYSFASVSYWPPVTTGTSAGRVTSWRIMCGVPNNKTHLPFFFISIFLHCRSQWPRGLRRRSAASRLLRSWVRIPPAAFKFVCCECCVLSGRGLCDGLITRPEESYRLWCVAVCDLETPWMRRSWPTGGCRAKSK